MPPIPQQNPTGNNGYGMPNAILPGTGGPGNTGFGNSMNPNPIFTTGNPFEIIPPSTGTTGMPTTSMNPGTTSAVPGLSPADSSRLTAENQNYFGQGMGALITQYLNSNGGFNLPITEQAVSSEIAAMQPEIQSGFLDLNTYMGETGVGPNSSTAALMSSNYFSRAVSEENAITAQEFYNMWDSSQNRELNMLEFAGNVNATGTANQPTALGDIGSFLSGGLAGMFDYMGNAQSGGGSGSSSPMMDSSGILNLMQTMGFGAAA